MSSARRTVPDAEALVLALRRLPPRDAQLLTLRFVEGAGIEGVARARGIAPSVVPVHTLRSARLLAVALGRVEPVDAAPSPVLPLDARPRPDAEDAREAALLEAHLSSPAVETDAPSDDIAGPDELATHLRALAAHASEVRRLSAELEARQRASPAQRRADLLRRVAVVALVALALWLYLRGGK